MSHDRLAVLIQAHQEALLAHPEAQAAHEAIISLLQGVDAGEITPAQCVRVLRYQATLVADAPAYAALYRQAAADIWQMRREEYDMPAPDYNPALLSDVQLTNEWGRWRVHLRYDERRYDLGTFLRFADAHRQCSASSLEKVLGSPEKRAACQAPDE
jgi:hypothetical protein